MLSGSVYSKTVVLLWQANKSPWQSQGPSAAKGREFGRLWFHARRQWTRNAMVRADATCHAPEALKITTWAAQVANFATDR